MLGLVLNDTVAAAVIGASFTACLSLMAWIVLTLAKLNSRVSVLEDRFIRNNGSVDVGPPAGKVRRP